MTTYPYDEELPKDWTRTFWDLPDSSRWAFYLGPLEGFAENERPPKPLLHIEMECAGSQSGCLPKSSDHLVTLALLVGDRFEPLLQTIWAFAAHRIVPVVNEYYGDRSGSGKIGGIHRWRELRGLIERLPEDHRTHLADLPQDDLQRVADNPTAVFNYLRDQLKDDLGDSKRRVVIDITGAKKTMVAGAFLFAAFTNCEISYVDFDRYDKKHGPYGYTCRIAPVSNPFEKWELRQWERAIQLYSKYDFGGALEALPESLWDDAPSQWKTSLANLRTFIGACKHWENGDLKLAKQARDRLPSELQKLVPLTVERLCQYWPSPNDAPDIWVSDGFLTTPRDLILYAEDELHRARRLAGRTQLRDTRRDYRAAFARAYALHETLIKARAVALVIKGQVYIRLPRRSANKFLVLTEDERSLVLKRMLNSMLTNQADRLIRTATEASPVKLGRDEKTIELWRDPDNSVLQFPFMPLVDALGPKRNLITHTYVPVTEHDAERAIVLAEANLKQYRDVWAKQLDEQSVPNEMIAPSALETPAWEKLLDECNLDFLPRPRRAEQEET